ncbi:MAG: hypothetical protein JO283_05290 [Bradyrhizobium sp.]|nr:hypothetical protein [Bradyrhizobium sp.]
MQNAGIRFAITMRFATALHGHAEAMQAFILDPEKATGLWFGASTHAGFLARRAGALRGSQMEWLQAGLLV